VHCNVITHPTATWALQQLREPILTAAGFGLKLPEEYRTNERPFPLKLMPNEQSLPLLSSRINPKYCLNWLR
jgi:hypothetical protein